MKDPGKGINRLFGVGPNLKNYVRLLEKGMSGDILFKLSPATTTRAATSEAWTRYVDVTLETEGGEVLEWFNGSCNISIADNSTAGTASIQGGATSVVLVNGRGRVQVNGSAHAWLEGETNTLTIAEKTILGYTVAAKTSVETITA